jgi:hypothetical protein
VLDERLEAYQRAGARIRPKDGKSPGYSADREGRPALTILHKDRPPCTSMPAMPVDFFAFE